MKTKSSRWCSSLPHLTQFSQSFLKLISGRASVSPCNPKPLLHANSHLEQKTPVTVSVLVPGSTFSVCFNDLLMDDCFSSEWGFLAHSSVRLFPCLRFRSRLFPFWSSLSLFHSISSWAGPHATSLLQCLFESSTRINVLKRKGARGGLTSLCYRREIYMGS